MLYIQPVRLLVSARAYQTANSIFLSQQTSTSRAHQPRNQPANRPTGARPVTHGRHGSMARRSSSLRAGQALHVEGALIAPVVARAAPL